MWSVACTHEKQDSLLPSDLTVSADVIFSYKEKSNNPENIAFVSVPMNDSMFTDLFIFINETST